MIMAVNEARHQHRVDTEAVTMTITRRLETIHIGQEAAIDATITAAMMNHVTAPDPYAQDVVSHHFVIATPIHIMIVTKVE